MLKEDFMRLEERKLGLKTSWTIRGGESDPPHIRETIRYFIIPPLFVVFLQYIMVVIACLLPRLK